MEQITDLLGYGLPLAVIFSGLVLFLRKKLYSRNKSTEEKVQETIKNIHIENIKERQKEIDTTVKVLENERKVSEKTKEKIGTILKETVDKIKEVDDSGTISELWDKYES